MKIVSFLSHFIACTGLLAMQHVAAQELSKPQRPIVELLEEIPQVEILKEVVTVQPSIDEKLEEVNASLAGCPFPSVQERTVPVEANIFGPVQRVNGLLPAEVPIGVPFDGPVEGTEYIRISSANGNGGHYYSTVQAWNADMTKIMIGDGGVDQNRILNASNNYALLPQRVSLTTDRVWSNIDPDIIYGISGKSTVYKLNVATGQRTAIYNRPNNATISFMGKPNIPDDDSKMVFLVKNENKLVTINLKSDQIPRPVIGELNFSPYANLNTSGLVIAFDHPGKWVIVSPPGPILYRLSPDLKNVVKMPGSTCCHNDAAYNTAGESVQAETIRYSRLRVHNYDTASYYDSPAFINRTAGQTDYWFSSYVSGRGQTQCGRSWVLLSGEEGNGSPNHPLGIYKIDGNTTTPTFKVLGGDLHSGAPRPNQSSNLGKQKAVQSPDGNAVLFDSDGGVAGGELSTYILRDKSK